MTTLTCKAYRATVLPTQEIRLEIVDPTVDALTDKLSMSAIAELLGKDVKTVDRLSRRPRNPLPLHRPEGIRPFGFRYEINAWLQHGLLQPAL
jgi:hypothetical protein